MHVTYFLYSYLSKPECGKYKRQSPNKFLDKGRKEFRKDVFIGTKREHSETVGRIFENGIRNSIHKEIRGFQ